MNLESVQPQDLLAIRLFWLKTDGFIILIGYLLGSIPFGYLAGRAYGMDIRRHGSGNIGATNVMRTLGKRPGYTVFACDALKGLVAVVAAKYIADHHTLTVMESLVTYHGIQHVLTHSTYFFKLPEAVGAISAAIACILGHNFPLWLGFKGGKGMATSAGVLIGMMPQTAMGCMLVWAAVFFVTRYVSLASIAAALALPLITMILLLTGVLYGWPYFYFAVAACFLAVWRHRSNIVRLVNGTENRFEKKAKAGIPPPEP